VPYTKVVLPNANLESIFSCSNQPVFIVGPDLRVIYANSHAINLVGKTKLENSHCYELFHADKKQPSNCPWRQDSCGVKVSKDCMCSKGKTQNPCRIEGVSIKDPKGKMVAALHMIEVTTEVVRLTEELLESNKELQLLNELNAILSRSLNLEETLDDALQRLIRWSDFKAAAVFLSYSNGYIEMKANQGLSARFVRSMKRLPFGQGLSGLAAWHKKIITSEDVQLDIRTRTTVMVKEKLHATIAVPMIFKGKLLGVLTLATREVRKFSSREIKLLESIADQMAVIVENAQLYQQTIVLSRTDNLTTLSNSRYFEEILQKQMNWAKRKNQTFALLMLDIDNLKTINDLYGHDSGDLLLRKFAQILTESLRETDYIARYGGDEFVALLPDSNEKAARLVAEKIRRKVASTRIFGFDLKPLMTISAGIAIFPKAASTMISLVKAADIAMYRSKEDGKNKVCLFEPSLLPGIHFNKKRLEQIAHNADFNTIQTLVTAVDLKDSYTGVHSSEVSRLAVFLAQRLGLGEEDMESLRIAALLHDVGKIGVADSILLKPHKLSSEEFEEIKKHPKLGVSILKFSKDFKWALPIVLHHHERWDGRGYPNGTKGEKIPLLARIISVADAFEAMTSDRPYRKAMSKKKALTQLWKFSNRQFDPGLVQAFTGVIKDLDKREKISLLQNA
jgi:diguanylate cyclase (GGDEF)-like protein/putative nucleotidyltransferase with HDIG domain